MSISIRNSRDELENSRFAFQHFDRETDFGVENANGERVRKKKKPGRKPNPPSIQQKRAQNRAAQKAFREREQLKNKEKERQRNEEVTSLKKQLAIVQYEANYLRACVLHLTLAHLMYRGSAPHSFTESRIIPNEPYDKNEVYEKPAHLEMLLENHNIIDLDQALRKSTQYNNYVHFKKRTGSDLSFQKFQDHIAHDYLTLNKSSQDPSQCLPKYKKRQHSPSPSPDEHLSSPLTSPISPLKEHSLLEEKDDGFEMKEDTTIESESVTTADDQSSTTPTTNATGTTKALTIQPKPLKGVLSEPPPFKTAAELSMLPPLQALHIIRLQLKISSILGHLTSASLLPTVLQRIIPHDIRIDYVPGPGIRDKMILFQGLYDIDACFNFLTETAVFIGGDVRNARNWLNCPEYSLRFWFLSHQLVDENIDDRLPKTELYSVLQSMKVENLQSTRISESFETEDMVL